MSIPRLRLLLVSCALIALFAVGAGLVQAASATPLAAAGTTSGTAAMSSMFTSPDGSVPASERTRTLRGRLDAADLGRLWRHLVHGAVTVMDRDGKLITLQFDRGTIDSIDGHSITIGEAGGSSVTVGTTTDTRVRKGRASSTLAALVVGDDVVVVSVLEGGSTTARSITVPSPRPKPLVAPTPGSS